MAKQESPSDLDADQIRPAEGGGDPDSAEVQPKEKPPWWQNTKAGLHAGLRHGRRYGHLGLRYGLRLGWPIVLWSGALALSFFLLVRGSMYAYQTMGWGTWSSIAFGVFGAALVFSAYLAWLWTRITGAGRMWRFAPRAVIAIVAGYSMCGILYLSAGNSRDPGLGDYYRSLHPLMRLGASTYFLFDRDGVVTDPERTAADYLGMGLSMNEASLHFKLEDRYVHAMDLRTTGRSPRRNRFTVGYLRFMGFRSLHQVAAADHLHVSLPVGRPLDRP